MASSGRANLTNGGTITGALTQQTGGVVFNEDGGATDFRVESDTDVNALFVKGSTNRVGVGTAAPATKLDVAGSVGISTAGGGLLIKEGSNATMGTLTLNGITEVTVSTTAVTATSRIFLTVQAPGGVAAGVAYVSSRSAGTSFGVKGLALDTSTVAWLIVEPAA